jgi:hypothetical protein
MIVDNTPIRIPVPHEQYPDEPGREGEWIEFRRLPARKLRKARKAKDEENQAEAAEMIRRLGPEFMKAMQEGDEKKTRNIIRQIEELEYHISNFKEDELLGAGVVGWSYDVPVPSKKTAVEDDDPTNPADVLDEITARWAAEQVVFITRPPTEEEEGKS